ncbi:MAG: hypothetical protein AB8G86_02135 [Saprospiraceae bacterium]
MSSDKQSFNVVDHNPIGLKDFIDSIHFYLRELYNYKVIMVAGVFLSVALFYLNSYLKPITYSSKLTFTINQSNNKANGIENTLSKFGLSKIKPNDVNFDKIKELATSQAIIHKTLFNKVDLLGKNDFLVNHLIDIYGIPSNSEAEKEFLKRNNTSPNLSFSNDDFPSFTPSEHIKFRKLHEMVVGNVSAETKGLVTLNYGHRTGIIGIHVNTLHDTLSVSLVKILFKELSNYYIKDVLANTQHTFSLLEKRAASIKTELVKAKNLFPKSVRTSSFIISNQKKIALEQTDIEIQRLSLLYEQILKNKENISFTIDNQMPVFRVLDQTYLPVFPDKNPKSKAILQGAGIGFFLMSFFIIVLRAYYAMYKPSS